MNYNTSTSRTTGTDKAIASVLVAGVMFVLGYTVVRANLAYNAQQTSAGVLGEDVEVVVPHEGTLWSDVGTSF